EEQGSISAGSRHSIGDAGEATWQNGKTAKRKEIMKALAFYHPGKVEVNDVDDLRIEDAEDIILRVTATAICGTDLHIYNGFMPQKNDIILGHEFRAVIEEAGSRVEDFKKA